MAFEVPSTQPTGTLITSTMYAALTSWKEPPSAQVRRDAAQTLSNLTWESVEFDTEDFDSDSMWSSTNNDQVFVNTAGKYMAVATVGFQASSGGTRRDMAIAKNSTSFTSTDEAFRSGFIAADLPNLSAHLSVAGMFDMTTSDYLTLQAFQNSGGTLDTSTGRGEQPKMSVVWISS